MNGKNDNQPKSLVELVDEKAAEWVKEHGFDDMVFEGEPEMFDQERADAGDYIVDANGTRYRIIGVTPVVVEVVDEVSEDDIEEK